MFNPPRCCAQCGPMHSALVLEHDYPWTSASGFTIHCDECVDGSPDGENYNSGRGRTIEQALNDWDETQVCLAFELEQARARRGAA